MNLNFFLFCIWFAVMFIGSAVIVFLIERSRRKSHREFEEYCRRAEESERSRGQRK